MGFIPDEWFLILGSGRGIYACVQPLSTPDQRYGHPRRKLYRTEFKRVWRCFWTHRSAATSRGLGVIGQGYCKRPSGLLSGLCAALGAVGCHQFTDLFEAMGLSLPLAAALAVGTSHVCRANELRVR